MRINGVSSYRVVNVNTNRQTKFKGAGQEIISEGFREVVADALPLYKGARFLYKAGNGDTKGAIKQGVGVVDNIVCQPAKQAVAGAAAAKGAAIGTAICPGVGTFIGAATGYIGTLLCWGKVRNTIVDAFMD